MLDLLDVNTVAVTVLGYPLSWIELVGTVLYLASVWLITRRNILTWPVGIASVVLYAILFYQIRLYADTFEQLYFLGVSIYGWVRWKQAAGGDESITPSYSPRRSLALVAGVTLLLAAAAWALIANLHVIAPTLFPQPASHPAVDALTTVMSFTAMWLMARTRTESWIYWIIVDALGIWLYFVKDVRFIALLYVVLLFMAINGFRRWSHGNRSR